MGKKISTLAVILGTLITVYSGWYIMRGPFFGRPMPPVEYILGATGVFIVGIFVLAYGIAKFVDAFSENEGRVDLEQKQQRTYKR